VLSAVTAILVIAVSWAPARALFHFGPMHWNDLAICLAAGLASILGLEAIKSRWFR
jgi:Ca2+-transporting ATPase